MRNNKQILILDTHVWIWLMEGSPRLKLSARKQIEEFVTEHALGISAISIWEVAMLESKGRVSFDIECGEWIKTSLSAPGISLMPIVPEIAVDATRLPGDIHGDPADRIIIATTRFCGGVLVTADRAILDYAKTGFISVVSAL